MNAFIRAYALLATVASYLRSPFLLVIRLVWGWQFFQAGYGKFFGQGLGTVAGFFGEQGIPLPYVSAFVASSTEMVGGLFLLVGFATRLTALPLIFTMIVAYAATEMEAVRGVFSDPDPFFAAAPFLFLFACVILLIFGPGVFSVDYFLKRKYGRAEHGVGSAQEPQAK